MIPRNAHIFSNMAEANGPLDAVLQTFAWGPDLNSTEQGAGDIGGLSVMLDDAMELGGGSGPVGHMFPVYDGNGNITRVYSTEIDTGTSAQTEVAEYRYGPFGENRGQFGEMAVRLPFRWSTKFTDNETALVYYGYRYYSGSLGRWVSRDPIGEGDGQNIVAFTRNSPGNVVDPNGLWSWANGGRNNDSSRAMMTPNETDNTFTAAKFASMSVFDTDKWLIDETKGGYVHPLDQIDPCSTYSVPNTVYINIGDISSNWKLAKWLGWQHFGLDTAVFANRAARYALWYRVNGINVVTKNQSTAEDMRTSLRSRDIFGWIVVAHGSENGSIEPAGQGGELPASVFASNLEPALHHRLGLMILHSCYPAADPLWDLFVSEHGDYYASEEAIYIISHPPKRR